MHRYGNGQAIPRCQVHNRIVAPMRLSPLMYVPDQLPIRGSVDAKDRNGALRVFVQAIGRSASIPNDPD